MKFLSFIFNKLLLAFCKWFHFSSRTDNNAMGKCWSFNDNNGVEASNGLPGGLKRELMPGHVALFFDGSRRWGKKRGLTNIESYQAANDALIEFIRLCVKWEIPIASLLLFSSGNWRRPKDEIDYGTKVFIKTMKHAGGTFKRVGARISVIGDTSLWPISLQETIKEVEETTKNNTKLHLILAMSYSGQDDIVQACKNIAIKVKDGVLRHEDVTKSLFEQELQTKATAMPCPDLLIRTGGLIRISDYYLWQAAYSELYFTDVLWPDFGEDEFIKALRSYQQRGRRFGRK